LADAVASQILVDGARNCVMKFTNVSDGTGEAAVLKVDVSALSNAPARVSIEGIQATTFGMGVDILWDATADVVVWHVPQDVDVDQDFTSFGGIPNNAGAGITGDIMFTTIGATAGDRYSIILKLKKD
jgi:hypothetical protein